MAADFMFLATTEAVYHWPTPGEAVFYLGGIILFLILNALFVAAEFAFVKVRPSQLETEFGVFLDGFFLARVAGDPTFLSHNSGRRCYGMVGPLQVQSRQIRGFFGKTGKIRLRTVEIPRLQKIQQPA